MRKLGKPDFVWILFDFMELYGRKRVITRWTYVRHNDPMVHISVGGWLFCWMYYPRTLSVVEGMRMRNPDIKKDRYDSNKVVCLF